MVTQADVVVIGAGALGSSAAFHLAQRGLRVALLDRYAAGSQTSPRAAGLFKQIQANATHTQLALLSIRKALSFEAETGVALEVVRSGSLMAARTPQHAALIRREVADSQRWGAEVELVDGAEAQRLMPALESSGLLAAAYTPGDVYIEEPGAMVQAYLAAATRLGAAILSYTTVLGVIVEDGEVRAVMTDKGSIATPAVVDAAGAWARAVGAAAGASVPVVPVRHQLYISRPIAGIDARFPIVRLIDAAVYVRPARGGLMLGGFEADPLPLDPAQLPDFSMDDVPLDFGVLERQTVSVERQIPALQDVAVQEHRGGLFTMTADGRFMVGPLSAVRGFWVATGCNGSGFSSSPGIGQLLAEWMVDGSPSIDISLFAPDRFAGAPLDDESLRAAGVWQYAHYYDPHAGEA